MRGIGITSACAVAVQIRCGGGAAACCPIQWSGGPAAATEARPSAPSTVMARTSARAIATPRGRTG
jgi:hypothetical protein